MFRQSSNGELDSFHDVPMTMKSAAAGVLDEAVAARDDLRATAADIAAEARAAAAAMQVHARRAAAISGSAAAQAMQSGRRAGTRAWQDARRHATEWGATALEQARSRPAMVVVGVAVIGVAVGFWLRGTSRRATPARPHRAPRKTTNDSA